MPAGDASLTTAQVNQKNALTAITVSTAISEMSPQIIPLKGRKICGDPAEFWLQRLLAFELRHWGYAARVSAAEIFSCADVGYRAAWLKAPLANRVRAIVAARREALIWRRTRWLDT